jgi:hypothetical protein
MFDSSIKNDILTSSNGLINDEDTTNLFGRFLKIKIIFKKEVYQKLMDLVLKFIPISRTYRK